eukprot:scaffold680675_cov93-Prasinocladus_malaysianus.AAC.1
MDRYGSTPLDEAQRHNASVMQYILEEHGGRSGKDPELQKTHAILMSKRDEKEAHKSRLIEAEQKQGLPEMRVREICQEIYCLVSDCMDDIRANCI